MVNNINNLRIFRWIIACTIVMMSVNFYINPVGAESGTIIIDSLTTVADYAKSGGQVHDQTPNFSKFYFDTTNYNSIVSFRVHVESGSFTYAGNSSSFQCVTGCTGWGVVSYDAVLKNVSWVWASGNIITSSPFVLSYENDFMGEIIPLDDGSLGVGDVGINTPLFIGQTNGGLYGGFNGVLGGEWLWSGVFKKIISNDYEVTYPLPEMFQVNVTKSGTVGTKIYVHDASNVNYFYGDDFDTDLYSGFGAIGDQIWINMTTATGAYTDVLVNSSTNETAGLISWEFNSYDVGDTAHLSTSLDSFDNTNYTYEVSILKPNGVTFNNHYITANESNYDVLVAYPGAWYAYVSTYAKTDPDMLIDQDSDTTQVIGTSISSDSWIAFNDTYYTLQSSARIDYSISDDDYTDAHRMQIFNSEGTEIYNSLIVNQSGYRYFYWAESGIYTVQLRRVWFALDWDLSDYEVLASDTTEVTNTITGAYDLSVMPSVLNCGQIVHLSADTPNFWNTTIFSIKNVTGVELANISGQSGSWRTNQTGQFWVYFIDDGAIQDTGYFEVYGTCTGYDQISPGGSGGIKPKPYPQTDQATSNANLQNNLIYFMGLPIFWGMILFCGILITAATLNAGRTIPYLAPVIIMFELVIGLLEPYSSYIAVGMAIVLVMYFIANFAIGYNQGSS